MFFIGIFISIVILLILVFFTIILYLKLREQYKNRKVLNEISIIGFVFLISFVLRLTSVLLIGIPDTVGNGIASGWYLLYNTIGGLSFEGIEGVNGFLTDYTIIQCLYYGAVIYAALTSLLIISVGISYELYSYIKMRAFYKKYKVIYIFTAVSEESLLLAQDIREKEAARLGKNKFAILFLGNGLEAFDKKNDSHRIIMNNGFFYWSYGKKTRGSQEESIAHFLHYTRKNSLKLDRSYNHNKLIHVFALSSGADQRSDESTNSDVVFDDVKAMLSEYVSVVNGETVCQIPTVINYYLATHGDINYQIYISKLNTIINEFLIEKGIAKTQTDIGRYIQLHLINEAYLTGVDLLSAIKKEFFNGEGYTSENIAQYQSFLTPNDADEFHVSVIGFGDNGKNAMSQLFVGTSWLNPNSFVASKFIADIYDRSAETLAGRFAYAHPFTFCRNCAENEKIDRDVLRKWSENIRFEGINGLYQACQAYDLSKERVRELMGFPILLFHNQNCFRLDYMKQIDSQLGGGAEKRTAGSKAYIIALGNDEENVCIANSIIDDFKHEELILGKQSGPTSLKVIFVNVRDCKSIARLNWTKDDRSFFTDRLRVIPFGCAESIWSYKGIVDDEKDCLYNYLYSLNDPYSVCTEAELRIKENFESCGDLSLGPNEIQKAKDLWLKKDPYEKESNRAACRFAFRYKIGMGMSKEYFDRIEHLRWNRFYIVHGWIYADYPSSEKVFRRHNKEHTCLCPFELLSNDLIAYDTINVTLGKNL